MAFQIKTKNFEGPVDLLMDLVKKSEIDIYNVWISEVTSQYLKHISVIAKMDLDESLDFLIIASSLVYLKSRSLLPRESVVSEGEEEDPQKSLEKQLQEYEKYQKIAQQLKEKADFMGQHYTRPVPEEFRKEEYIEATLFDLVTAFKDILKGTPKKESVKEIEREVVTVEEKIEEILKMFASTPMVKFKDIFKDTVSRIVVIVSFLALLELIRMQEIRAIQNKLFGEIELIKI